MARLSRGATAGGRSSKAVERAKGELERVGDVQRFEKGRRGRCRVRREKVEAS